MSENVNLPWCRISSPYPLWSCSSFPSVLLQIGHTAVLLWVGASWCCPVWSLGQVSLFAASEWGHWVLQQPDTGFESCEMLALPFPKAVVWTVSTSAYLNAGRSWSEDRQQSMGCFALAGTVPQWSLNPWFREQEEGVAFPMPGVACVCLPEALLAVLEWVLCVWEALLLPFPPPPFSSPKKGPVLQLNWIFSSGSRCLRSYLLSLFAVPSPFSGIFFPQYCWVWKSVVAIKLTRGCGWWCREYQAEQ